MKTNIKQTVYGFVTALVLLGGANFIYAQSTPWVMPTQTPPAATNIAAPVHVGSQPQIKNGTLEINGSLAVLGSALFTDFSLQNGTQAAGRILTSDANGKATWQQPPTICQAI